MPRCQDMRGGARPQGIRGNVGIAKACHQHAAGCRQKRPQLPGKLERHGFVTVGKAGKRLPFQRDIATLPLAKAASGIVVGNRDLRHGEFRAPVRFGNAPAPGGSSKGFQGKVCAVRHADAPFRCPGIMPKKWRTFLAFFVKKQLAFSGLPWYNKT